jgi:hypothetical protein
MTATPFFTRRKIAALVGILGFVAVCAYAADADLQQYNGTATWFSDLTAAPTLLPVDGKKVTADDNAAGKAPVNRSLKQLKDMLIGLHDAVIGSRVGAVRRTLKSVDVDGVGGQVSSLTPGDLRVSDGSTGVYVSVSTPFVQVIGAGAGGESTLLKNSLVFTETVGGGGNPPRATGLPNTVLPLNTIKAWGRVFTDAMGNLTILDGFNIAGCVAVAPNFIDCTFASGMDNTSFLIIVSRVVLGYDVLCNPVTSSKIRCEFYDAPPSPSAINCTTTACSLHFMILGRQTT